jgi:hypothetical protein
VGLPFKKVKAEITWDVLNLINLFDSQKGLFEYANFNDLLVVRPTVANGVVTYDLRNIVINGVAQTPDQQLTRDDLRSRWQMQLGGRIRF